ncbi:MAG: VOC family protein [Deltaproteobacteria bacterium]|nr:VOC family protein [Deltaproteobacteria bacterium]
METQASIRFDHFAYPVDDLVKAEDFYTGVLEVPIFERRGLRVIDVRAGTLPRTFLNVAGSRVGIFLGREPLPQDQELNGAPVVGIEVTSDGFKRIHRRLEEKQPVKFDGPRVRERLGPKAKSILLQDPFGNHLELIEKDRPAANGSAYLGLSQLELEVVDLDRSEAFYRNVFGLKVLGREKDALGRETSCLQLHSGQWLILHKVPRLSERSSANYRFEGQHYAFFTPTADTLKLFREAVAREGGKVDALEQTQVRSATAHGLYFTDFDGNPLQLQVEGSE